MLYIFLLIGICLIFLGIINDRFIFGDEFFGVGIVIFIASFLALTMCGASYNHINSTTASKLEVLNSQNELVLNQIEPLVQQALNYESNTYKEFKLTPENIVAFGNMYPQLQANSFIQSQINIIVENQKEIKHLRLQQASLNAYHLWLFTKKN